MTGPTAKPPGQDDHPAATGTPGTEDKPTRTVPIRKPAPASGAAADDRAASSTAATGQSAGPTVSHRAGGRSLFWLLPVLAFVGGLLLGGAVIAVADLGSSDDPSASSSVPSTTPTGTDVESTATTVTVPAACADGLDKADTAAQAAKDGITGITQLDSAAIRRALDQLQTLQPEIRDLATRCRNGVSVTN